MTRPTAVSSRPRGAAFDLLAAFETGGFLLDRRGIGVGSSGVGAELPIPAGPDQVALGAAAARAALDHIEGPAVVVGAFPFDPSAEATLVVPERAVVRIEPGEAVEFALRGGVAPSTDGEAPATTSSIPSQAFTELQLSAIPSADAYAQAVAMAVARIRAGDLSKVVLARTIEVHAGRELDPRTLLARLRAVDPDAYAFAVPSGPGRMLVGASPELLVARRGRHVSCNPLAGSAPRSGDSEEDRATGDALLASAKDREEHAIVVDAMVDVLQPYCEALTWDPSPVLLETANVWHLSTRFLGVLREPAPDVLELVAALHPTPAVGGAPRDRALELIHELEPFDRACYAGPVGWIDANGDGDWATALRCAELEGERATLYAGAGIVAGSEPLREVDETERKFRAFLDALRWG